MTWSDILLVVLYWAIWYALVSMLSIPFLMHLIRTDDPMLWGLGPKNTSGEKMVLVGIVLCVALIWPLWSLGYIIKKRYL